MKKLSALTKYALARWELLEPIVSHGLDAAITAIVVHITSITLSFFLPSDYTEAIEKIEFLFYFALTTALSFYTLVVFCLSLSVNLLDAIRRGKRRLSNISATEELPSWRYQNEPITRIGKESENEVRR